MVTRDVLKVRKLHSPTARAILRTFKTSLINKSQNALAFIRFPILIPEQRNKLVSGLHVWFSENFFETQGQNACIYNNCWTTKLLRAWGPDFFVYPHFQKSKNTRLVSHEHLTKKLRNCFFCQSKMGVDLYTGKCGYYSRFFFFLSRRSLL